MKSHYLDSNHPALFGRWGGFEHGWTIITARTSRCISLHLLMVPDWWKNENANGWLLLKNHPDFNRINTMYAWELLTNDTNNSIGSWTMFTETNIKNI